MDFSGSFDFSALQSRLDAAMPAALDDGGEVIKTDAADKAPKESTRLVGTAKVDHSRGGRDTVGVTFDGPYARYQHEHLGFKHPHGGQAKFLEAAMLEKEDDAKRAMADRIRAEL
jgi:hypothetical protein